MTTAQHLYFTVVLAINEPDLAMTAKYEAIRATSSLDATQQAIDAAEREFGGTTWSTERVEMV